MSGKRPRSTSPSTARKKRFDEYDACADAINNALNQFQQQAEGRADTLEEERDNAIDKSEGLLALAQKRKLKLLDLEDRHEDALLELEKSKAELQKVQIENENLQTSIQEQTECSLATKSEVAALIQKARCMICWDVPRDTAYFDCGCAALFCRTCLKERLKQHRQRNEEPFCPMCRSAGQDGFLSVKRMKHKGIRQVFEIVNAIAESVPA